MTRLRLLLGYALLFASIPPGWAKEATRPGTPLLDTCRKLAAAKAKVAHQQRNECRECPGGDQAKPGGQPVSVRALGILKDEDGRIQDLLQSLEESGRLRELAKTPLGAAIVDLLTKFSSRDYRKRHLEDYLRALERALSLIPESNESLRCYREFSHPRVTRTRLVQADALPPDLARLKPCFAPASMALQLEPDHSRPNGVQRLLVFNADIPPIHALIGYAHEMTHGCNRDLVDNQGRASELQAKAKRLLAPHLAGRPAHRGKGTRSEDWYHRLLNGASDLGHLPEVTALALAINANAKDMSQLMALDEIRAFDVGTRVIQQVAAAAPELACAADLANELAFESMRADGVFPLLLFQKYARSVAKKKTANDCKDIDEVIFDERSRTRLPVRTYTSLANLDVFRIEHLFQTEPSRSPANQPARLQLKKNPATGLPLLRPELRKAIEAQGHYLAP